METSVATVDTTVPTTPPPAGAAAPRPADGVGAGVDTGAGDVLSAGAGAGVGTVVATVVGTVVDRMATSEPDWPASDVERLVVLLAGAGATGTVACGEDGGATVLGVVADGSEGVTVGG